MKLKSFPPPEVETLSYVRSPQGGLIPVELPGGLSVNWAGISGKPAVIGAGANQAAARAAIGAVGTADLDAKQNLIDTDVYNWKPSNTRRLQRSLAAALAGTGYSDHLFIGDSLTSAQTGDDVVDVPASWSIKLRSLLAARGIPIGGSGWVFTYSDPPGDPRWSKTGSWAVNGYGFLDTTTSGSAATFTSDIPGTTVEVMYFNAGGPFTIAIDGGAPVTVTPDGSGDVDIHTITGLPDATHQVRIASTTNTNTFVLAAQVYRDAGVRLHNAAMGGYEAVAHWSTWLTTFPTRPNTVRTMISDPDVIHIALGVNDIGRETATRAQVITALTALRNAWPDADCILYGEMQPSGSTDWPDFINDLYALAATLDCPLVDLYKRWGTYSDMVANDMLGADDVHPNKTMQADLGVLVAGQMTRGMM